MNGNPRTDFLTSASTFVIGMGSVMNLGGNYFPFNRSDNPEEADQAALAGDWALVANDMRAGIDQLRQHEALE